MSSEDTTAPWLSQVCAVCATVKVDDILGDGLPLFIWVLFGLTMFNTVSSISLLGELLFQEYHGMTRCPIPPMGPMMPEDSAWGASFAPGDELLSGDDFLQRIQVDCRQG